MRRYRSSWMSIQRGAARPFRPFFQAEHPDRLPMFPGMPRFRCSLSRGRSGRGHTSLVTITYPTQWSAEIEAALWAWETFGGLGARTRRGFGALHLLEINGESARSLPDLTWDRNVDTRASTPPYTRGTIPSWCASSQSRDRGCRDQFQS